MLQDDDNSTTIWKSSTAHLQTSHSHFWVHSKTKLKWLNQLKKRLHTTTKKRLNAKLKFDLDANFFRPRKKTLSFTSTRLKHGSNCFFLLLSLGPKKKAGTKTGWIVYNSKATKQIVSRRILGERNNGERGKK